MCEIKTAEELLKKINEYNCHIIDAEANIRRQIQFQRLMRKKAVLQTVFNLLEEVTSDDN